MSLAQSELARSSTASPRFNVAAEQVTIENIARKGETEK